MKGKMLVITALLLGTVAFFTLRSQPDAVSEVVLEETPHKTSTIPSLPAKSAKKVLPKNDIKQLVHQDAQAVPTEILNRFPNSLKGVPLPQSLDVDAEGRLLVNDKIKKLFDFYLTAIGEESLDIIVARIQHQLQTQFEGHSNDAALEHANLILEQYLHYRNELAFILRESGEDATQHQRSLGEIALLRNKVNSLRMNLFDEQTREAFFAEQEQYDNYMFAMQQLAVNEMTKEQRTEAVILLNANAPQWLVEQQRKSNALARYQQRAVDLPRAEARALAEQTFGVEAADRLAQLQQKREQWNQSLKAYHRQLVELLSTDNQRDELMTAQIEQLRLEYFERQQIKRVAAIDSAKFGL